ncbi:hypothetical protein SLEP1_g48458 [Rubroshorea leprosula]|uniref:Peptidase A1 domain-containing protein n=1 Tax=Rubroshorea leprosula TaxID=152421 RepID=A0AAV5LUT8_9ROSI|nr:hypothetical protein SLEP1_g48458 [Rubroshorea leprosula]
MTNLNYHDSGRQRKKNEISKRRRIGEVDVLVVGVRRLQGGSGGVGGKRLSISASVFTTAGTIIDSGTVITRLPATAYSALRTAFRQGMSKYPMGKPLSILDTCYDLSSYNSFSIPKISISFSGGVEVEIALAGILYVNSPSQVCLAFAGNNNDSNVGILGNVQQKTLQVVYDSANARVGFATGGCS